MFNKLENITSHINNLSHKDWQKLFSLIPKIQRTKKFVLGGGFTENKNDPGNFMITPIIEAKIVHEFQDVMIDLGLIIDFNWGSWNEGKEIADRGNYENIDTVTLLKLLTAFIRNNRFCDGVLASKFEDRTIENILIQLKKNFESDI